MAYVLRYYVCEHDIHPQKVFEKDGLTVLQSESEPLADCWFIKVESLPSPLPKYYSVLDDFKFTYPERKFQSGV